MYFNMYFHVHILRVHETSRGSGKWMTTALCYQILIDTSTLCLHRLRALHPSIRSCRPCCSEMFQEWIRPARAPKGVLWEAVLRAEQESDKHCASQRFRTGLCRVFFFLISTKGFLDIVTKVM